MLHLEKLSHGKLKLVDEYPLKSMEIVLFVENKHRLFVINSVNSAETQVPFAISSREESG